MAREPDFEVGRKENVSRKENVVAVACYSLRLGWYYPYVRVYGHTLAERLSFVLLSCIKGIALTKVEVIQRKH